MAIIGYLGFALRIIMQRGDRPATEPLRWIAKNRAQLSWLAVGIALVGLLTLGFGWVKSQIPFVFPFWADPVLANLDRNVFGADPFVPLRAFLGSSIWFVDLVYSLWYPATLLSLSGVFLLRKNVAIVAYFLTWGFWGLILQIAWSSAGPIFWSRIGLGPRFDAITQNVPQGSAMAADYLWAAYIDEAARVGSGISAMPSLHVGMAAWIALAYSRTAFAPIAVGYWVVVFIGSVALGWHYFMDGFVGTLMALASFPLARVMIGGMSPSRNTDSK